MKPVDAFSFSIVKTALCDILDRRRYIIKEAFEMNRDNLMNILSVAAPVVGATAGAYRDYAKGGSPLAGGMKGLLVGGPIGLLVKALQNNMASGGDGVENMLRDSDKVKKFMELNKALHQSQDPHLTQGMATVNALSPFMMTAYKNIRDAKKKLADPNLEPDERSKYEFTIAKSKRQLDKLNQQVGGVADVLRTKMVGMEHLLNAPMQ